MKKIRLFLILLITSLSLTANALVIKDQSKYRKISKGVGNVIFSSKPLPHQGEDKYTDIRNTFYSKKDKEIYARAYFPGTLNSIFDNYKNQYPDIKLVEIFQLGEASFGGRVEKSIVLTNKQSGIDDWDQQRYDLLPEGDDSDFRGLLTSLPSFGKKGKWEIAIFKIMKVNLGKKYTASTENDQVVVRETGDIHEFIVADGRFDYIVE